MSDDIRIEAFDLKGAAARFHAEMSRHDPTVAFHIEVNSRTLDTLLAIRTGDGPEAFERFVLQPRTLLGLAEGLRKALDFVKAKQAERGAK